MSSKNPRKVYVSNISRDTRERDLGRLFEEVGRIERLQFKNRFAFVQYERSRDCDDCVHKFDGMYFMGRRLRVEPYCYRGGDRKYRSDNYSNDYRVFVTNLDSMTSWQDLKDFGRTAGKSVTFADVRIVREGDYSNKRRELEGIIEYSDIRDFENALKELDGARLNGVRVKVYSKSSYDRTKFSEDNEHQGKGVRRGRSRSYTRSRSRRRSRSRSRSRHNYTHKDHRDNSNSARSRSRSRASSHRSQQQNKIKTEEGDRNHMHDHPEKHYRSQSKSPTRSVKAESKSPQ